MLTCKRIITNFHKSGYDCFSGNFTSIVPFIHLVFEVIFKVFHLSSSKMYTIFKAETLTKMYDSKLLDNGERNS